MLAVSIRPAEHEYADTGGRSSVAEASFNFVNSIVGAGMIGSKPPHDSSTTHP